MFAKCCNGFSGQRDVAQPVSYIRLRPALVTTFERTVGTFGRLRLIVSYVAPRIEETARVLNDDSLRKKSKCF